MKIVGITIKNDFREQLLVDSVFKLKDTYGLPLSSIIDRLAEKELLPSWEHYLIDGLRAGHKLSTLRGQLIEAFGECYGFVIRDQLTVKLDLIVNYIINENK